jgi:hypothetical protein
MRKKLCTSFLLLVLSIQILPVQQMGNLLFSNTFTEEIPHSADLDKDFTKKEFKSDYLSTPSLSIASAYIDFVFGHRFIADAIPQNHSGDIHVPPPNC